MPRENPDELSLKDEGVLGMSKEMALDTFFSK
jgi:hypothetical protein